MTRAPRVGRTPDILRKGGPMRDKTKYNRKDEATLAANDEDEGRCRFNCRTAKENWKTGYRYAAAADGIRTADDRDAEEAYHEWKDEQTQNT